MALRQKIFGYAVDLGLPAEISAFSNDPEIKTEAVWVGEQLRRSNVLAERRGPGVRIRAEDGSWSQAATSLPPFDSMMTHAADPKGALELMRLRDRMRKLAFLRSASNRSRCTGQKATDWN